MGETENINITYEALFDILRLEKNREELQKIYEGFYDDALKYLKQKQSILENEKQELFGKQESEKTKTQIQNIKKLLKEIYEKRERKIINIAIYKSRTNSDVIDTSALLKEEKPIFESLVELLTKYRSNILENVINLKEVNMEGELMIKEAIKKINTEEHFESEEKENEELKEKEDYEKKRLVRFLHPVPKFMGKELEVYGPFEEEDVAHLPLKIAEVLIKKGRAQEINE